MVNAEWQRQRVLDRIMDGADPAVLGRRGGLKAARLRRQKKQQEKPRQRRYTDEQIQNMWWNKD